MQIQTTLSEVDKMPLYQYKIDFTNKITYLGQSIYIEFDALVEIWFVKIYEQNGTNSRSFNDKGQEYDPYGGRK